MGRAGLRTRDPTDRSEGAGYGKNGLTGAREYFRTIDDAYMPVITPIEGKGLMWHAHTPPLNAARPNSHFGTVALAPIRAIEFCRPMSGASHPVLARGEDDKYYVVKLRNLSQHPRLLANEMLAARLALLIGLPVPEPALIEVPPGFITGNAEHISTSSEEHLVPQHEGLHFGSTYPGIPGRTLVVDFLPDRILRREKQMVPAFLGAFVFDLWTLNRNSRQTIFSRPAEEEGSPYEPWLIDQGFCFNAREWNFPDGSVCGIYPRCTVYESVRGVGSFEPFISRIECLEPWEIGCCARNIPSEWCGEPPGQILGLSERLCERGGRIRRAVVDAVNARRQLFPHWSNT